MHWEKLWSYWRSLTLPAAAIREVRERQQANLLAGLSLALLPIVTLIVLVWIWTSPGFSAAPFIAVVIIGGLFFIYILSRTLYHRVGAFLFIAITMVVIVAIAITAPGSIHERLLPLNFLAVAILLSGILLPVWLTCIFSLMSLAGISVLFFVPSIPFNTTYSLLVFMIITSALITLSSIIFNRYIGRLYETQERYQALFNQSNDAVFLMDLDGNHVEVNQNAADMLGYAKGELTRLSFRDIVAPEQLLDSESVLKTLLENKSLPIYERVFNRKDGTKLHAEVNVELVKDADGKPRHLQSIIRDIEERKRAEVALRASEERFRRLTLHSPDSIYIYNLVKNQVDFSNRDEFLGYTMEELSMPGSITEQVHIDDRPKALAFWQSLVSGEVDSIQAVDYRIRHKNGRQEWVHNRAIILARTPEGNPAEILIVATLITESKQAEEKLVRQGEYLRVLIEQTPVGIVTVDMQGNITEANPRSLELLDAPDNPAVIGLNILNQPPFVEAEISPMLMAAFSTGKMVEIENWYTSLWGKTAYLIIRAVPHFDVQKHQIGLIIIVEDLTQRMQALEGMRQMQKMESLSVLAGGIAHDFNNLLVAMLGQTSLAMAKLRPESPGRPHVKKAVTAAEQAARLTQQLLAYSGHGHYQVALLDLNGLIEENLHLFAATIPKQIHIRTKLLDALSAVEVDVAQIQQVVMNLIINAAEAIGDKRGTITIISGSQTVTASDSKYWQYTALPLVSGNYVTLEVHDDGPGMTQETIASIFDPFFTTKEKGHGLGLAAVLGIIRGHKGGLTVYSEVGRGTTFKLLLPASDKNETKAASKPENNVAVSNSIVLVVDDEEPVREAVTDILALENIQVLAAPNGKSGLAIYQERQSEIGLVLLDLSMPGWSGEETMRQLRKVNPTLRIILSSGYNEIEATQRFTGKGLTGFLQKPYSAEKLIEIIQHHLSQ